MFDGNTCLSITRADSGSFSSDSTCFVPALPFVVVVEDATLPVVADTVWIVLWQSYTRIRTQIEPSGSECCLLFCPGPVWYKWNCTGNPPANQESTSSMVIGSAMVYTIALESLDPYQDRATSVRRYFSVVCRYR